MSHAALVQTGGTTMVFNSTAPELPAFRGADLDARSHHGYLRHLTLACDRPVHCDSTPAARRRREPRARVIGSAISFFARLDSRPLAVDE